MNLNDKSMLETAKARWRYTAITRAAKELIYCRVN